MQEVIRFALLGFGIGAAYSLASQGLVLIYRGSGVLNLAHGAIGMVGAYVEWELRVRHSQSFAVAFIGGVLACALLGAATYLLVMRPLRRASPLVRIVATLGVLVTLQAAAVIRYTATATYVPSELPVNIWHLSSTIIVTSDRMYLAAIAAILSVVLWALYKFTLFGLRTSAVAENQRAAASIGCSPDRVAVTNWSLGSALAGVAAILIAPITTLHVATMTDLVLAATAAALVASFRSFPIAFAAAMAIGIAQTEINRFSTRTGLGASVPFIVIIVVLIIRGKALPLRDFFLQRLPSVGSGRVSMGWLALGVGIWSILIWQLAPIWQDALTTTIGAALVMLSIVVLTGYCGQLSLAQYALAGFGALVAGRLVAAQGWPFWAAFLAGVAAAVPVGVVFALPAVRTRGIQLAIVTLGLGTAMDLMVFRNGDYTGGFAGTVVGAPSLFGWNIDPITHSQRYGAFALALFVIVTLAVANLRRGRSGRRLLAVRTNERAAAALGISVPAAKLYAFAVSAAIAAVGGILLAFKSPTIVFTDFANFTSITYVGYAMVGGIGYLLGPLEGATLATGTIGTQITNSLFEGVARWIPLVGGILIIVLVLLNQNGIVHEAIKQIRWVKRRLPPLPKLRVLVRGATENEADRGLEREKVRPQTLEIRDLIVRFGGVTAVDGVTLTVRPGEILGLIGPNGAGKTTVIDAVTGFTRPAAGTITLDGNNIGKVSAARRARQGLSRSFQSLELFGDATVLDNLRVASDPRDTLSYVRDLVYPVSAPLPGHAVAAIEEFELGEVLDTHVDDLAYGQRRLLAIARAIATGPSVLLLDEPAAGLGDIETAELARLVRRLADNWGFGILLVEHDMNFVMSVCDQVVVLDFGRQISEGTTEHVRADPAVIAAYLGETEEELDAEQGRSTILAGEPGE